MALDEKALQDASRRLEKVAEKRFKKMGYRTEWLDHQGKRKRPEFQVLDSAGPVLICEVKCRFSAGFLRDRGAHVSTMDLALLDTGVFSWTEDFEAIYRDFDDAVAKYQALIVDRPELSEVPLVVVVFFDAFADCFDRIPDDLGRFPDIAAFARVVRDRAIQEKADKITLEEIAEVLDRGSMKGFPPNSKELHLVLNRAARLDLPVDFVARCVLDD